jgi:hypothetical protein
MPFFATTHERVAASIDDEVGGFVCFLRKDAAQRGIRGACEWVHYMTRRRLLKRGELLLTDNEGSFTSDDFQHALQQAGVLHKTYPAYRGALMDPCDNSFHAAFKRKYYSATAAREKLPVEERLRLMAHTYRTCVKEDENDPGAEIRRFFAHCGITSRDPTRVVRRFFTEGYLPAAKWEAEHEAQRRAYEEWAHQTGYTDDEPHPLQLPSGLDGDALRSWQNKYS